MFINSIMKESCLGKIFKIQHYLITVSDMQYKSYRERDKYKCLYSIERIVVYFFHLNNISF